MRDPRMAEAEERAVIRSEVWRQAREHYASELARLAHELNGYPHGYAQGVALAAAKIRDGEL